MQFVAITHFFYPHTAPIVIRLDKEREADLAPYRLEVKILKSTDIERGEEWYHPL